MKAEKLRTLMRKGAKAGKKKCCKSSPRCKKCPVVLHRMTKYDPTELSDKELVAAFKKARKK